MTAAVPDVTPAEALDLAAAGAVLLDVREPAEWDAGHVAGSALVPLGSLDPAAVPSGRRVVAVCRSGNRSRQAAVRLADAGLDVVNLAGGVVAWADQGLPLVTGPDGRAS